jgi:hypothetical protein
MPLLDHFRPPLSRTHPWRGFHGAWAAAMARLLNAGVLPPGYYAVPFLDRDGPVEIDVATLHENTSSEPPSVPDGTHYWSPPDPALAVTVEWPGTDDVRVEVFADEGDPRLAAAVELVSPRNKDRARDAFAAKCADYLRRGCGLVVVDAVTTRRADLHADLLALLDAEPTSAVSSGPPRWRWAECCRQSRSGSAASSRFRSTWRQATLPHAPTSASGRASCRLHPERRDLVRLAACRRRGTIEPAQEDGPCPT